MHVILDAVEKAVASSISLRVCCYIQKGDRFLCIALVSCNLTDLVDKFQEMFGGVFRGFSICVPCRRDGCTASFPLWMPVVFLPPCSVTPDTVLFLVFEEELSAFLL